MDPGRETIFQKVTRLNSNECLSRALDHVIGFMGLACALNAELAMHIPGLALVIRVIRGIQD